MGKGRFGCERGGCEDKYDALGYRGLGFHIGRIGADISHMCFRLWNMGFLRLHTWEEVVDVQVIFFGLWDRRFFLRFHI